MALLCHKLLCCCEGGIPVGRSLQLLTENPDCRAVRDIARDMANAISCGYTLEAAVRAHAHRFPATFVEMIAVGERTGCLDRVLAELSKNYAEEVELQRQILQAVAYPLAVLVIISYFLYPLINVVLKDGPMSQLYRAAFYFARDMAILAVLWKVGFIPWVWRHIAFWIWPFSIITRKLALSRFSATLALTFCNGVPPVESIKRAAAATLQPRLERDLLPAADFVSEGATLAGAFAACSCLPPMVHDMINVGEASGKLDESLRKAAQYLRDDAIHSIKNQTRALAAAGFLIVFVGRPAWDILMMGLRVAL